MTQTELNALGHLMQGMTKANDGLTEVISGLDKLYNHIDALPTIPETEKIKIAMMMVHIMLPALNASKLASEHCHKFFNELPKGSIETTQQ